MTDFGQGDPAFKAERVAAPRAKRPADVKARAAFVRVVAPSAKLPAHYEAAGHGGSGSGGGAPGGGAGGGSSRGAAGAAGDSKGREQVAKHQAETQAMVAKKHEADERKRVADYKPLHDRYVQMQKLAGMALAPTESGRAEELQMQLTKDTGFMLGAPSRSRLIEGLLAQVRQNDSGLAQADVAIKLDRAAFLINLHTQASIEGTSAGGFMDHLVKGVDLSKEQIKATAEAGMRFYLDCQRDEALMAEVTAFIDGVKVEVKLIKHLYDSCMTFSRFIQTAPEQIAAAEASGALFGPLGPGIAAAIIVAEAWNAIAALMSAIGDSMNLISQMTSGTNIVGKDYYDICAGFTVPKQWATKITKNLTEVQSSIKSMQSGFAKGREAALKLKAYRDKGGHATA